MYSTIKSKNEAIENLREYSGQNPYLLTLKRDVFLYGTTSLLTDFVTDYINSNINFTPIKINKTVSLVDWYGEKLKEEYEIEFTPKKLLILVMLGETNAFFHCIVKYRQNMEPMQLFLPKKGVIENFLVKDFHDFQVDFERYDRLASANGVNRTLMPHQQEAVKFLLSRKKCILADDMGLGKTTSLTIAAMEGNYDSILIICPASLKTNWLDELKFYVPERDITIIESINEKTKPELEKFLGYAEGKSGLTAKKLKEEALTKGKWSENKFVILNFDILDEFYEIPKTRSKENIAKALENSPMLRFIQNKKSLLIIDEAHRLSNSKSQRYKIINDLIKRGNPEYIFLSTGTPVTNNPQNLYCLLKLLGEQITDDYNYYVQRYCGGMKIPAKGEKERWTNIFLKYVHKSSFYDLTSDEKDRLKEYIRSHARMITICKDATNLDELKGKIAHIYLRRTKEDLNNNLPPKTIHEIFYEFTPEQKAEYSKLWDEYEAAQLEADPTKEINKDLLEGAIYRRYCSNEMVPNTIKWADSFIANNEKVVIFCCYDDELYTLKDYYGDKCVIYNGKISQKEKDAAVYSFMNDENKMVFIGNIQSAGVGITLTVSHKLIFNNISFVPADNFQAQDRLHRIGQKHPVDIYFQFFKDTQYEKMWNVVLRKDYVINKIIKKEDDK